MRLIGQTELLGVVGWPVAQSRSPAMHNAALRALGLEWTYVKFAVPPERLGEAVRGARALGVRGLNVTITTTARTDEEGRALLRHLGLPFRAEGYTAEERAARRRRKQRKYGRGRGRR